MSASLDAADDGTVTGINVTPLVDIMLVLLVVFMVTAHLTSGSELKIQLPKTAAAAATATPGLTVTVDEEGALRLMRSPVDLDGLISALRSEAAANPGVRVTVAADGRLPYQRVVDILDSIRKAGVTRVALAGEHSGA
ncbi:MAG: biopolymer transporter ExbD [Elusimicrobiota bacterium]|nr:biopolymer transporter ExbD [Elusimicrobiota bacterium]